MRTLIGILYDVGLVAYRRSYVGRIFIAFFRILNLLKVFFFFKQNKICAIKGYK